MKKYLSLMKIGWLDAIEYRTEFIISYMGWIVSFVISLFIWIAVTKSGGGTVGGYDLKSIVTYFLIIQIIRTLVFSRAGWQINSDIQSGDLSNWLLKPINYMSAQLIMEFVNNAFRAVFGLLMFGVIIFFYNPELFSSFTPSRIVLSVIIVLLAHVISFLIVALIALSAFWVVNANRFLFIYFSVLTIFSGMIIPLDLFPERIANVIFALPLPYIFYFPTKLIQGTLPADMYTEVFAYSVSYIILLSAIIALVYKRGIKKYEAVGR